MARKSTNCILLCTDAVYEPFAFALITQIVDAHPGLAADICLVSEHPIAVPDTLANLPIKFLELDVDRQGIVFPKRLHLTFACYLRLFAVSQLAEQYDRILYLDCDIYLSGADLPLLFETDLLPVHVLGAVRDRPQQVDPCDFPEDQSALGCSNFPYFNSGVLLIDTKAWQTQQVLVRILEVIDLHGPHFQYNDQSALNLALAGHWSELPWRWNWIYDRIELYQAHLIKPVFTHFAGGNKPWDADNDRHPPHIVAWYRGFLMTHYGRDLPSPAKQKHRRGIGRLNAVLKRRLSFLSLIKHNLRRNFQIRRFRRRFGASDAALDPWSWRSEA